MPVRCNPAPPRGELTTDTVLTDKDVVKRMEDHGADVETSTPEQLGGMVRSELAKWKLVVQRASLKAE